MWASLLRQKQTPFGLACEHARCCEHFVPESVVVGAMEVEAANCDVARVSVGLQPALLCRLIPTL